MIDGNKVYACKKDCKVLGELCHDTKNRVVDSMCGKDESVCKELATYMKCLMTCECLCSYAACCCCEMEKLEDGCLAELASKCRKLEHCCDKLKASLSAKDFAYLNCAKLKSAAKKCGALKKSGRSRKRK